jgi:hypothetical protein
VPESELYQHLGWQWCTPEGARKQVLALGLQTTLREKLEWLEEAETFALRLRKIAERGRSGIVRVEDAGEGAERPSSAPNSLANGH